MFEYKNYDIAYAQNPNSFRVVYQANNQLEQSARERFKSKDASARGKAATIPQFIKSKRPQLLETNRHNKTLDYPSFEVFLCEIIYEGAVRPIMNVATLNVNSINGGFTCWWHKLNIGVNLTVLVTYHYLSLPIE